MYVRISRYSGIEGRPLFHLNNRYMLPVRYFDMRLSRLNSFYSLDARMLRRSKSNHWLYT